MQLWLWIKAFLEKKGEGNQLPRIHLAVVSWSLDWRPYNFFSQKSFYPKPELHNVTNQKVELLQCIKVFSINIASKALQTCSFLKRLQITIFFKFFFFKLIFNIKAMKHDDNVLTAGAKNQSSGRDKLLGPCPR